jgi:hypothetical protein
MEVLFWIVAILMVMGMLTAGAIVLVYMRMQRRNRVSPDLKSPAPLMWLWSPQAVARLHRRLRDAVTVARMVRGHVGADDDSRIVTACHDLEKEAIALDNHLALVARLPARSRRAVMPKLVAELGKVERAASQVSMMAARAAVPSQLPGQRSALDDLVAELELLDDAHLELHDLESEAGLQPGRDTVFEPLSRQATPESRPHPGWMNRPRRGTS